MAQTLTAPALSDRSAADLDTEKKLLRQINEAAAKQANAAVDRGTDEAVSALSSQLEQANRNYQAQRNAISADEMKALDNQALYSEMRGDRGGIGAAQYASIQNTAARNRNEVNSGQQTLAADTAAKVAQLRKDGEYKKADSLLSLTQKYLSGLMDLEKEARQSNADAEEFNAALAKWQAEYDMKAAQYYDDAENNRAKLTGSFSDGTPTQSAADSRRSQLAEAGNAMLKYGLIPTEEQLAAMGWTPEQYNQYRRR